MVGVAKCAAHDTNDATMCDHEPHRPRVVAGNVVECATDTSKNFMVWFITRGAHVVFYIARKLLVDFSPGETLPRTNIDFTKTGVRGQNAEPHFFGDEVGGFTCTLEIAGNNEVKYPESTSGVACLFASFCR